MIRFGVIGAGRIARTFCNAVNGIKGNLYAIASRDLTRAAEYMETYGFEEAYDSYDLMMKDPKVDCVYIATPHGLHYEHMMLALTHHKHIICEKPFTLNEKEALEVLELAKKNKCFVMEAMWTRFLPTIREVQTLVNEGIIGDIEKIEVAFGFDVGPRRVGRLFDPLMGGGALLDIGVYSLTFAHLFLGSPLSFETTANLSYNSFDLSNESIFYYEKAKAYISSRLDQELDNTGYLYGSKGYIKVDHFWQTEKAFIYNLEHQLIKEISYPHQINGFEYEIKAAIHSMENKQLECPLMPHHNTLEIMRQMDLLRKEWNLQFPTEKE
jgi:predicted dehydrogenase